MNLNYKKLLHLTYEIEGLLLVQMDRPERHSAELDSLIAEKIALLASMTSSSSEDPSDDREQAEEIAESAIVEETEDAGESAQSTPAAPSPNPALDSSDTTAPTIDERIAREKAKDIFKAFTLNDKFRFRRELFRNSQAEFDETLEIVSAMNSLAEAEEYFYEDLCWNPENEDVKAFMEVVAKHF